MEFMLKIKCCYDLVQQFLESWLLMAAQYSILSRQLIKATETQNYSSTMIGLVMKTTETVT